MYMTDSYYNLGDNVMVNLDMVRDRVPSNLLELLKVHPYGIVMDYKMTDGNGVGLILRLNNGEFAWFFAEELQDSDGSNQLLSDESGKMPGSKRVAGYKLNGNKSLDLNRNFYIAYGNERNISKILSPKKFFNWLTYSLKDVF